MADRVAARLGDTSSGTATKINEFLDDVMAVIAQEIQFPGKLMLGSVKTVSGQYMYGLEPDVAQIKPPMLVRGKSSCIYPIDLTTFRMRYPDPDSTGTPRIYIPMGSAGVREQPASYLRLISTSASDVCAISIPCIVRGVPQTIEVTLTGATAVLSTEKVTEVTGLPTADAAAVGTITCTANSTLADATLPVVATAGHVTVFSIALGATQPTTTVNPGSIVRIKMTKDAAADRNKQITIEGYGIEYIGSSFSQEKVYRRVTLSTDGTLSTTEVTYPTTALTNNYFRFTKIENVTKNWDATETMIVTVDPQNVVAVIPPSKRSMSFKHYGFYPFPDGTTIDYAYFASVPSGLENDSDEPPFDPRAHLYVERWAEMLIKDFRGSRKGTAFIYTTQEFARDMERLKNWEVKL